MRIEKLHFKNINSLKGEWTVDFTDPELTASGLFLITGVTGSGKSSILDAITLALYGKTPRIDRISQTGNEVMTRRTSQCFAEVVFSQDGKHYLARWQQKRARNQAAGKLQNVTRTFTNLETRETIENISRVRDEINLVTKMSYEQFTTSVLLAQGSFTEFLKSDADERAKILEQITGTEIYSRISKEVYERFKQESQKLENLKSYSQGISLLDESERKENEKQLVEKNASLQEISRQVQKLRADLDYFAKVQKNALSIKTAEDSLAEAVKDTAAFMQDKNRLLEADEKAKKLTGVYTALQADRNVREDLVKKSEQSRLSISDLESSLKSAVEKLLEINSSIAEFELHKKQQDEIFSKVIEADTRLSGFKSSADKAEQDYDSALKDFKSAEQKQQKLKQRLTNVTAALNKNIEELSRLAQYSSLADELSGIKEKIRVAADEQKAVAASESRLESISASIDSDEKNCTELKKKLEQISDETKRALEKREAKNAELKACLNGSSLELIAFRAEKISALKASLERVLPLANEVKNAKDEQDRVKESLAEISRKMEALKTSLELSEKKKEVLSKDIELQKTRIKFKEDIEKFQLARSQLKEGTPCPCCGSLKHPYAEELPKLDNSLYENLASLEKDYQAEEKQCRKIEKGLGTLEGRSSTLNENLKSAEGRIASSLEKLSREMAVYFECLKQVLPLNCFDDKTCASLQEANAETEDFSVLLKAVSPVADSCIDTNNRVKNLNDEYMAAASNYDKCLSEQKLLDNSYKNAQQNLQGALKHKEEAALEYDSKKISYNNKITDINALLKVYGLSIEQYSESEELLKVLEAKNLAYKKLISAKEQYNNEINSLNAEINAGTEQLSEKDNLKNTLAAALKQAQELLTQAGTERRELFGDKKVSDEKAKLEKQETRLKNQQKAASANKDEAQRGLDSVKQAVALYEQELQRINEKLKGSESSFSAALNEQSFADEKAFRSAILSEETQSALTLERERLQNREATLKGELKAALSEKESLADYSVPELNQEELSAKLVETEGAVERQNQEIGRLKEILKNDEDNRQRLGAKLEEIKVQQSVLSNWTALKNLIGSADGKLYRSKVQAITFRRLLDCANIELASLSDRYQLVPNADTSEDALGFYVQDEYLDNEVRSCKNLSGGESFLVSLALALGLARLSQLNTRIESLFLDEGFGTLDSKSLETAIDALENMRQRHGLVGLISHVEMLKDRIASKILIERSSDGTSVITGSGVCCKM